MTTLKGFLILSSMVLAYAFVGFLLAISAFLWGDDKGGAAIVWIFGPLALGCIGGAIYCVSKELGKGYEDANRRRREAE